MTLTFSFAFDLFDSVSRYLYHLVKIRESWLIWIPAIALESTFFYLLLFFFSHTLRTTCIFSVEEEMGGTCDICAYIDIDLMMEYKLYLNIVNLGFADGEFHPILQKNSVKIFSKSCPKLQIYPKRFKIFF